ncbi:hypothetical protein E2C01_007115 [Portunus trituberculatus]|uniref:Uncharacterized protein n=1 Tax=Portunus trituberculatus TaxID=210409 RepID=A0A5B7CX98_PORTR|nr:hypothetical protein [Portunus trituberculatus]
MVPAAAAATSPAPPPALCRCCAVNRAGLALCNLAAISVSAAHLHRRALRCGTIASTTREGTQLCAAPSTEMPGGARKQGGDQYTHTEIN